MSKFATLFIAAALVTAGPGIARADPMASHKPESAMGTGAMGSSAMATDHMAGAHATRHKTVKHTPVKAATPDAMAAGGAMMSHDKHN